MAVTSDNNLLLSVFSDTKLRLLNVKTGQMSDSRYNVEPLWTFGIHITKDQRVYIGAVRPPLYPGICRKPLFKLPHRVTSTSYGNIWVEDNVQLPVKGSVIVLQQTGSIVQIFDGYLDINSRNRSFDPQDILKTPGDNVVVVDCNNHTLQILDHDGVFLTYIRLTMQE
ncbi:unnamed protein product [Mytilus coruscus]|uniref:Uncharacterized protein n=1 Tax=Mytilus coruscus TaxID=42192 RepID=A0A6J7ZZM8_MYTCO|nr:unnamed protein product [Mytilus coruscus]